MPKLSSRSTKEKETSRIVGVKQGRRRTFLLFLALFLLPGLEGCIGQGRDSRIQLVEMPSSERTHARHLVRGIKYEGNGGGNASNLEHSVPLVHFISHFLPSLTLSLRPPLQPSTHVMKIRLA